MREAHVHLHLLGESLSMPDFQRVRSCNELLETLSRECQDLRSRTHRAATNLFLRAFGLRLDAWDDPKPPTIKELDDATFGVPVVVMCFDHHSALANSAARELVQKSLPIKHSSTVASQLIQSHDSSLLHEETAYAAWKAGPEPTLAQRRVQIMRAIKLLSAMGFTEIHDLFSPPWLWPMLGEMDRLGQLSTRICLFTPFDLLDQAVETRFLWESSMARLAGAKVFADGTLGSRTAYMLDPYIHPAPDTNPHGQLMLTIPDLVNAMKRTTEAKLQLAVHAIGDGAVRTVLDARQQFGSHPTMPPLRIEHCEIIDQSDVPRFAELNVIASLQPCHLLSDIEALTRHLPHRLDRVLPIRDLIEAGLIPGKSLIFGSDAPVVRPNPEDSITAATLRRRTSMPKSQAIALDQAISEETAWRCFGVSEYAAS